MLKRLLTCAAIIACLGTLPAPMAFPADAASPGQDGRRVVVAVMPFDFINAAPDQAVEASRRVQAELGALRKFTLIEQYQAEEFLKEASFRQEACAGVPCAQRLGRALGVGKVVMGTVTRRDELHWTLAAELIDVATGQIEQSASADQEGQFGNLVDKAPALVAAKLVEVATVQGSAEPRATPDAGPSRHDVAGFHPRDGFALYTGYANYTGEARLKSGGSWIYSGDAIPSLGLEYQWELSTPWTLAVLLEVGGSGRPSGKLGKIYNKVAPTFGGVEVRYWRDRWYVGGNLGSVSTCFYNLDENKPKTSEQCFYGTGIGATGGHQWPNGWFVGSSLEYSELSATEARDDPRVPKFSGATEYDWWVNVGYRWGQQ